MSYEPSDDALEQNVGAGIKDKGHVPKLGEPRGVDLRGMRGALAESRVLHDAEKDDEDMDMGADDQPEEAEDLGKRWGGKGATPAIAPRSPATDERAGLWIQFACAMLSGGASSMPAVAKAADMLVFLYEKRNKAS